MDENEDHETRDQRHSRQWDRLCGGTSQAVCDSVKIEVGSANQCVEQPRASDRFDQLNPIL